MTAYNEKNEDRLSRQIRPVLYNTAKDGSGTWYYALVDSDGHLQVDQLNSTPVGTNVIGKVRLVSTDGTEVTDDTAKAVRTVPSWTFGEPEVRYEKNSRAWWSRAMSPYLAQKGVTGWQACLDGRVQTGDDWAGLFIPVNEMPVPDFASALWTYYMDAPQLHGVNIVIWIHDPTDNDKRAEVTQSGASTFLEKANAWNAHEFSTSNSDMFFNGEGTSGEGLTAPFSWAEVQADSLFSTWTIYRISLEYGWYSTGTFSKAWLGDVKLNGQVIPLKPRTEADLAPIHDIQATSSAVAITISPKTPFRLLSIDFLANGALDSGEVLTITKNAGADGLANASYFDTIILSEDLYIGTRTSYHAVFGDGYEFLEDDELDIDQGNGSTKNIGCDVTWKPI